MRSVENGRRRLLLGLHLSKVLSVENYFAVRRWFVGFLLTCGLLAQRLQAEVDVESFKQLQSEVAALTESRDALAADMRKLREELAAMRAENTELKQRLITATAREYASRDDLRKVVDQVQEVDRRRSADATLVREKLEEIVRQLNKPVPLPPAIEPTTTRPGGGGKNPSDDSGAPSDYYEYTMKEGDILSVVISEYNKTQGLKVRLAQVLKANPNIKDANRVPVGTKVKIPVVK